MPSPSSLGQDYIRNIRYTDNLCKMFFLSDLLLLSLWLYISFPRSVSARCIGHLCLFVYFPFWKMTTEKNMIVHIVIDNKDGTMFPLLTVLSSDMFHLLTLT